MVQNSEPVLVDTNAIIEAHRIGAWGALTNRYGIETVKTCVTETQTGHQNRRPEQQIDYGELRSSLTAIHAVSDLEIAEIRVRATDNLDAGEEALWAHVLGRTDNWKFCGPDKASIRCGIILKYADRLVSLEKLLSDVGYPKSKLKKLESAYKTKWLNKTIAEYKPITQP